MKIILFCFYVLLFCFNFHIYGNEKIKVLTENFSIPNTENFAKPNTDGVITNDIGDMAWVELEGPHRHRCLYWNKNTGIREIQISCELVELGLEPVKMSPSVTCFTIYPIFIDNDSNVFLRITHKSLENLVSNNGSKTNVKLGVWNQKHGFNLLEFNGVKNIERLNISKVGIFVSGLTSNIRNSVFIDFPQNFWNQSNEVDTPWNNHGLGEIGSRIYAMGEMYRYPKSWINVDNTIISLMIEMEAASILDKLQYKIKKSLFEIERSWKEGYENEIAKNEYNLSVKYIERLIEYMNELNISHERVFLLELPSSKWNP